MEGSFEKALHKGSQLTSKAFMKDMVVFGIEQLYTSYDYPKGDADIERVMRVDKEEIDLA